MAILEGKPIEFNDFSGGMTDNVIQGEPKRFALGDNFVLWPDKMLETRYGTIMYDTVGHSIGFSRIASMFVGLSEESFFAQTSRSIYTQMPGASPGTAWSEITGPTGNPALSDADDYSQLSYGEFQRQIYCTTDAGALPGKIFRDHTGAWKAVTAGLPKLTFQANILDTSELLSKCIVLANLLRASFINHIEDEANITTTGGSSTTYQHKLLDKYSLSYLDTVSWSPSDPEYPGPGATPAPAATDATSLYALCLALSLAYEHHRYDAVARGVATGVVNTLPSSRYYHQNFFVFPADPAEPTYGAIAGGGVVFYNDNTIHAPLVYSGVVTTPQKAAQFLDDLAQKYYWHQLAPFTHSPDNDYDQMSRHLLSSDNSSVKIGDYYTSDTMLQVDVNYADFTAFALWIKTAFNNHLTNVQSGPSDPVHYQNDPYSQITLPTPVDYDSAALTIFWARYLYGGYHLPDARIGDAEDPTGFTMDTTASSANVTDVKDGGGARTLVVGSWVFSDTAIFNDSETGNQRAARVISSGSGTATLSRTAQATVNDQAVLRVVSTSLAPHTEWLHKGWDLDVSRGSLAVDARTVGEDLETWVELGAQFMLSLAEHSQDEVAHPGLSYVYLDVQGVSSINNNPYFIPEIIQVSWAAYYQYKYTVEPNGQLYLTRGAPALSRSLQVSATYPVGTVLDLPAIYLGEEGEFSTPRSTILVENPNSTLVNLPELVNDSTTNYDTTVSVVPVPEQPTTSGWYSNLTLEIYQTAAGGTTFFYLDSVENGTASYEAAANENYPAPGETALNDQPTLYTSGGVLASDQPPIADYVHQLNGFMYYGAIQDSGQYFPNRVLQSIQGAPDWAPATFYDDLDDALVGLTSTRSSLIAVCRSSVYRLQGSFSSTGQGFISHERISNPIGGLNSKSIVQTEIGVFFAGTDGFYYTDGFQMIKISLELDATYLRLTRSDAQKSRIHGTYDKHNRRILWAMQSEPSASDNDVIFVYYLDFGVKPSAAFTRWYSRDSWLPSSVSFFNGNVVIGDPRGYIFKTDSDTKTDLIVDTTEPPSEWITDYIPWHYRSTAVDLGTAAMRKWITKLHLVGANVGNVSMQMNSINDMGASPNGAASTRELAPVQYTSNPVWGTPTIPWGDTDFDWRYDGAMNVWRRFPSRTLRSEFKQVEFLPGDFVVYNYDNYPEFAFASVDSGTKTADILTPSGYTDIIWPSDCINMYIAFDSDNYATRYRILSIDPGDLSSLTYEDTGNTSTTASSAKWQISGVRKNQRVQITSFDLHTALLGDSFHAYPGATGSGGGYGGNV